MYDNNNNYYLLYGQGLNFRLLFHSPVVSKGNWVIGIRAVVKPTAILFLYVEINTNIYMTFPLVSFEYDTTMYSSYKTFSLYTFEFAMLCNFCVLLNHFVVVLLFNNRLLFLFQITILDKVTT
jgi:hypothetical protein